MALRNLFLAGLATSASAVKLLVSGYGPGDGTNGTITTLELTPGLADGYANATASLTKVAANTQCNTAPSWLDLSLGKGKLLCVDEGFTGKPQATIYTMALAADGSLKALNYAITPVGPVSSQFYNNNTALALAHYAGSAISTWKVTDSGFTQLQNISYANRTDIGPKPQQDHSHVHEAVIDPTGQYIIFPDLGLDAVHVFCIDPKTSLLTAHADLKSPTGYGPRHAAFWKSGSDTFLFVIHELTSRIISYKTTYVATGGLTFSKIDEVSTYGSRNAPNGSAAAEIVISPDNKFIVASNRLAPIFNVTNPDPNNSTQIGSDSIVTFKPSADGKLSFVQLAPSGGLVPRHFSLNKDGSMIAIANQNTFNMDIYARDIPTGTIGNKVASVANLPGKPSGGLTNVRWLE